jgi:Domain of unknown function (DUF4129)
MEATVGRVTRLGFVLLLLAMPATAARGARPAATAQSLASYVANLDALASDVGAAPTGDRAAASKLLSEVPVEWVVTSSGQTWHVPTDLLRSALVDWQRHRDTRSRQAVVTCLGLMRAEAASFERPPADAGRAHAALADVLRAKEFRDVGGPSALDRLRQQVLAWILQMLTRLLGTSAIPTVTRFAIYVLIAFAVAAAGFWMYRVLGRTARQQAATLDLQVEPVRPWDEWWTEARAEAAAGRWADAVRRAYWCGIAFLESRGAWRHDPSRTPREYLALVRDGPPAAGLGGLTRLLEHVWYGRTGADASSFDEAVACLRSIGCPSA